MFIIKSIIYFYSISLILGNYNEEIDPIIEPLELQLQSTDNEGIFYCNSRLEINKQKGKLMATIDSPIVTPPAFLLTTEQINSTTLQIRIKPNGHIGVNHIRCHWSDNATDERKADLIIGEYPGVIQLKERCQAYDRRYVQCIFKAATIARGFQNGFPKLYSFKEMNSEPTYRSTPKLVNIVNNTELVFHFEPRERNLIPKKTSMSVNMTLKRFGSSVYRFNIEPLHTTNVDFQIDNITNKQFVIRINHNNTGAISPRICSGHITYINDRDTRTHVQDIAETTELKILITRLRASTEYKTCLRCYYDKNDESFQADICNRTRTGGEICNRFCIGLISGVIVALAIGMTVGVVVFLRRRPKPDTPRPRTLTPPTPPVHRVELPSDASSQDLRYSSEPQETHSLINHQNPDASGDHSTEAEKYQLLEETMNGLLNGNKVTPDTIDLTRPTNDQ